jgi:two-component system, NtrC family, sensor histidine kinase AtoS
MQGRPGASMRKKILIIVSVFSLLAVFGGAYLLFSIGRSVSNLDQMITLHQIEIKREHLLLNVHQVQEDLYSQNTRHPESIDSMMGHVSDMESAIDTCFACHHTASVAERLTDLRQQIGQYSEQVRKAVANRTNARKRWDDQEKANIIGDSLIGKINTMIVLTNQKLNERTERSLLAVNRSKITVLVLVVAGPLMVALFAFTTLNKFAKPIQSLLAATKRLHTGDMESRIVGLKDEFAELAGAFNDMAGALRKRLREIADNERRYRLLFESAADAIFILDAEGDQAGRIVAANQAAAEMHQYTVEELTALSVREIDTPDAAMRSRERIERVLRGEWIKGEINHRKKDGTVFPVEMNAGVFEFDNHRYILAIDRDITERKRTIDALQRAEQLRTTGELATGLAHEIKNPLAVINVTIETLSEEDSIPEVYRNDLSKIKGEIARIEGLIKGLLNFARPPRPQLLPTDVNAVLESVAELIMRQGIDSKVSSRKIELVRDYASDVPKIIADPMHLKQVFVNLLVNAVDAMPGSGTVVLKTLYEPSSNSVTIALSDTGGGIDPAVVDKIFQPFFTTKTKGTGLGLAISKRLVEELGGTISIVSNAGIGATFRISLPCCDGKGSSQT